VRIEGKGRLPVEVLQNHLLAAAEEMGLVLVRTAYSPNIKERRDSSTAILDPDGAVVAQAAHIPIHLSSMMALAEVLFVHYPRETLRPGDMFVANDPYVAAGSHLNDVAVIAPVFVDGRLTAFVANAAHHADVGGLVPGSESGDSRSIWEDGLRLPVARLVHRGRFDDGLFRTILLNSRTPEERVGDLRAQVGANRAGARRIEELAASYGRDTVLAGMRAMLDYTERRLRQGIGRLARGTYHAEGATDDNGLVPEPAAIRLALTVGDGNITLDFTGTDAQVPGAKNVPRVSLLATAYYAVKAVVDPDIPANSGYYRAIHVHAPRGSLLDPVPPAAVAARFTTCQTVADVILRALAAAAPERAVAGSHGGTLAIYSGTDPRTGRFFVDYEVYAGGSGARATGDGMDAVANHTTNTSNLPIESLEREYPLLVERYELRTDSAGPGRFRGGLGAVRVVRSLAPRPALRGPALESALRPTDDEPTSRATGSAERAVEGIELSLGGWGCDQQAPPRGASGGSDGEPGAFDVESSPGAVPTTLRSTVSGRRIGPGGRVIVTTAGGGGFGDPLARDPERVLEDVAEGTMTAARAERAYGVVVRDGAVDLGATEALRATRRRRKGAEE
jgi:N-methylhydantoinase B